MPLTRVLITVKTYPTLSTKYDELVCTAGFKEDGKWIRVYPIPFRKLDYDSRYKKYDWVEIDLEKNRKDFRPESYKPISIDSPFKITGSISIADFWRERKKIVLQNVYTNLQKLKDESKDKNKYTSLAVFKPTAVLDFVIEPLKERTWNKSILDKLKANAKQMNFFHQSENPFEVVNKLPYKFSYRFVDDQNVESTLMIEDWEIGALYWKMFDKFNGNESMACEAVRAKYFDDFVKTRELFLFLGTTREFHLIAPNPFIIIGTFHPKKQLQTSLPF